jgi:hypothetical protein
LRATVTQCDAGLYRACNLTVAAEPKGGYAIFEAVALLAVVEDSMKFVDMTFLRTGAIIVALMGFLAACTVVVDEGPRPAPPRDRGPICTQEYAPVCGERRGELQTYGNSCIARAEGARIVYDGECRRESGRRPPQACTMEYVPVCAELNGQIRTFGNACSAQVERARILYQGECRRGSGGGQTICTREYAPVCATRRGNTRTFGNSCEAESAGYRIVHGGQC